MTKIVATMDQHIDLAFKLWKSGLTSEQAFEWVKARKYTVKGIEYFGRQVSTCVKMLERLDRAVKDGKVKCTKKNGLST